MTFCNSLCVQQGLQGFQICLVSILEAYLNEKNSANRTRDSIHSPHGDGAGIEISPFNLTHLQTV
jgi:hypothetical protein